MELPKYTTEEEIVNNGYRIYTKLDQNYQANMQVIYENTSAICNSRRRSVHESGSAALETLRLVEWSCWSCSW